MNEKPTYSASHLRKLADDIESGRCSVEHFTYDRRALPLQPDADAKFLAFEPSPFHSLGLVVRYPDAT